MSKYKDPSQRLRPETVLTQTGQPLSDWFQLLEQCKTGQQQHPLLAKYLQEHASLSQWWIHTIITAYEYHKGWRTVNQQKGLFTFTTQKAINQELEKVYFSFTDSDVLLDWLSPHILVNCFVGKQFNFDDCACISFLRVQPEKQIQLSLQTIPQQKISKATIDFTAVSESKTRIKITHSLLNSPAEVAIYREYWVSTLTAFRHYLKRQKLSKWAKIRR